MKSKYAKVRFKFKNHRTKVDRRIHSKSTNKRSRASSPKVKPGLTVMIMQWFSLTAPQHPKKEVMKTTTPTMIMRTGTANIHMSTKLL